MALNGISACVKLTLLNTKAVRDLYTLLCGSCEKLLFSHKCFHYTQLNLLNRLQPSKLEQIVLLAKNNSESVYIEFNITCQNRPALYSLSVKGCF